MFIKYLHKKMHYQFALNRYIINLHLQCSGTIKAEEQGFGMQNNLFYYEHCRIKTKAIMVINWRKI